MYSGILISLDVVVPVFNEIDCLEELVNRVETLRNETRDMFRVRLITVDDGSTDGSREWLRLTSISKPWIVPVCLTRNFGHQIALTAGLRASDADVVGIIDADLQDPPELLPVMVNKLLNERLDCVYGKRLSRKSESIAKKLTAQLFYRLLRSVSKIDIPIDTGDFRVLTRRAVDIINLIPERNRFLRALIPWTGLRAGCVTYERESRISGTSKYTLRKMIRLASDAVVGFSIFPLRLIQVVGLSLTMFGLVGVSLVISVSLLSERQISTSIIMIGALALLNGLTITSVGVVGGYVHRIQDEVRARPDYLIDDQELNQLSRNERNS